MMLHVGVEYEAMANPEIVARCKLFQELGDAVWVLAGANGLDVVYDMLDSVGFDCAVVYGETTHGYDIVIGRDAGEGRDIGCLTKSVGYSS